MIKRHELVASLPDLQELGLGLFARGLSAEKQRLEAAQALADAWDECLDREVHMTLLLVQIEGFDAYRRAHTPTEAEDSLRAVAGLIKVFCIRRRDRVFRWGDECFAAVLPRTRPEGARHVARRIVNAVNDLRIPFAPPGTAATLAVAAASAVPEAGTTPDLLVERAESALRAARQHGEICVVGDNGAVPPAPFLSLESFRNIFRRRTPSGGRRDSD
jgi:diguanylate cyclase (GGDEF)-like protein